MIPYLFPPPNTWLPFTIAYLGHCTAVSGLYLATFTHRKHTSWLQPSPPGFLVLQFGCTGLTAGCRSLWFYATRSVHHLQLPACLPFWFNRVYRCGTRYTLPLPPTCLRSVLPHNIYLPPLPPAALLVVNYPCYRSRAAVRVAAAVPDACWFVVRLALPALRGSYAGPRALRGLPLRSLVQFCLVVRPSCTCVSFCNIRGLGCRRDAGFTAPQPATPTRGSAVRDTTTFSSAAPRFLLPVYRTRLLVLFWTPRARFGSHAAARAFYRPAVWTTPLPHWTWFRFRLVPTRLPFWFCGALRGPQRQQRTCLRTVAGCSYRCTVLLFSRAYAVWFLPALAVLSAAAPATVLPLPATTVCHHRCGSTDTRAPRNCRFRDGSILPPAACRVTPVVVPAHAGFAVPRLPCWFF